MRARILQMIEALRTSFWFVPVVMMVCAIALAIVTARFDRVHLEAAADLGPWVYGGGPEGARQVLATIAGSMITVAGVVFSVTIVALSLASQQFGPRLLRNFMTDHGTQVVLGTFTSLFIYCILVLRTIRDGEETTAVPHLSVTVALALAIFAVGVLVYFIHHVSRAIQADTIAGRVGRELLAAIEEAGSEAEESAHGEEPLPEGGWAPVASEATGYLQAIDTVELLEGAERRQAVVRFLHAPGEFVFRGQTLAEVTPLTAAEDGQWVRVPVAFGQIRTPTQDLEYSVSRLVEMALRALSPSLNDPFTAIGCIDHLTAAFALAAERPLPSGRWVDGRGVLRLVIPLTTLERMADASFHQIRQASVRLPAVGMHLMSKLAEVIRTTRNPEAKRILIHHARLVRRGFERGEIDPADRARIDSRFADVLEAVGDDGGSGVARPAPHRPGSVTSR